MPKRMKFHDLEHTLSVTRMAVGIGQAVKLDREELLLLEVAALFHDTGYALAHVGHEEKSAGLAAAFLAKQGVARRTIKRVQALILATRTSVAPRGALQRVLRDADSSKAGQTDFGEKSERLRQELELVHGARLDAHDWLKANLAYLEAHRFFTPYARDRFARQKRINLDRLRRKLALPRKELRTEDRTKDRYFVRDLSWLSFNDRVLQEAMDPRNPLLERVKFLAIYSSNLDEFYRVRVASLRSLSKLKKTVRTALDVPAEKLIARINRMALAQQRQFGDHWRNVLLPALARKGVRFLREDGLDAKQMQFVRAFFTKRIAPLMETTAVRAGNAAAIEDRKLYFVCRLRAKGKQKRKERLVLVNIPSAELGRFVQLPSKAQRVDLLFLDDAIRLGLPTLFKDHHVAGCHAIKLSRDAELYLDEEFVGNVKDKVRKSLRKRQTGVPSRFLYDWTMPPKTLSTLRTVLGLTKPDMVVGGRYHNFNDLMKAPVKGLPALRDKPWPPLPHPRLSGPTDKLFATVAERDVLLHFPYHDFGMFLRWLTEAAHDPAVERISITLYRVAEGSAVCTTLLDALRHGKQVTVFVEVQARFDEDANLHWGDLLEKSGARVLYSYENLKVHCKLCLVQRRESGRLKQYAFLGTGNFNERTALTYSDSALITAHKGITHEVVEVFAHLEDRKHRPDLSLLLVAPMSLRNRLEALIDKEIEHALLGRPASVLLKLNSLEDREMIAKLYDASRAGVEVRLIVRGICCLVPGIPGMSERITAISIVDRYLEHARAYVFHNNGKPLAYLSSADWMERNLDHRVEVAFPLLDSALRDEMVRLLEVQWSDNVKARMIDEAQTNPYRKASRGAEKVQAQQATYAILRTAARKPVPQKKAVRKKKK